MRRSLTRPRLALAAAGLALLFAAAYWMVPYLTREREIVSGVPVPKPLVVKEQVQLSAGQEACLDHVAFNPDSEIVEFTVLSRMRSGPPLGIRAAAGPYRTRAAADGGYRAPAVVRADIDPSEPSRLGRICIGNRGRRTVALLGTREPRTLSRAVTTIDGAPSPADISLRFLGAEPGTVPERLGSLVDRISAFKPTVFEKPILWLVLALVVVAVPALALYALAAGFREAD
jgi:hypothetical protein